MTGIPSRWFSRNAWTSFPFSSPDIRVFMLLLLYFAIFLYCRILGAEHISLRILLVVIYFSASDLVSRRLFQAISSLSKAGSLVLLTYITLMLVSCLLHLGDVEIVFSAVTTTLVILQMITIRNWRRVVDQVVAFGAIFLVAHLLILLIVGSSSGDRFGGVVHPNKLGMTATLILPFVLFHPSLAKAVKLVLGIGVFALPILAIARTNIFLSSFVVLVWAARALYVSKHSLVVGFVAVFALSGIFVAKKDDFLNYLSRGNSMQSLSSVSNRTTIWRFLGNRLMENMWVGFGTKSAIPMIVIQTREKSGNLMKKSFSHAHNQYLDLAIKEGLPRAVSFLVLMVSLLFVLIMRSFGGWKDRNLRGDRSTGFIFLMAAIGAAANSLVIEGVLLVTVMSSLIFWCCVGFAFTKEPV